MGRAKMRPNTAQCFDSLIWFSYSIKSITQNGFKSQADAKAVALGYLMRITAQSVRITMPIYDYECIVCGQTQELEHSMSAVGNPVLHCSTPMIRVFAATPAIFKGTGWGKDKK
jgi:putative FmdB family regulatory protein